VTLVWTLALGVAIAAAQLPGAIVRTGILFVIFSFLTAGVGLLLLFSTCISYRDDNGRRNLISLGSAGLLSYIFVLIGAVVGYTQFTAMNDSVVHFIVSIIFASCLFMWVCYDAGKLCQRMIPDDYMKGVIYFYADFVYVCLCCALLSCLGSATSA